MSLSRIEGRVRRAALKLLRPEPPSESGMLFDCLSAGAPGTLVDVGAHEGISLEPFARAGWRVLAFEPDDVNRGRLQAVVAGMPNVRIDTRAVSQRAGETLTFYRSPQSTGISTLTPFTDSHVVAGSVTTTTLAQACREHDVAAIDCLKVDTEGYDFFVLQSLDWDAVKPRAILCEFEDRKTVKLGYHWREMAEFLRGHGYSVVVSEWYPVESYGGLHRFRRFADYPCDLADARATGNLIAFQRQDDLARFQRLRQEFERWRSVPMFLSALPRRLRLARANRRG